jgi:hypothetical protein
MRKLKLSLDSLDVTSFSVAADGADRGTVNANELPPTYEFCTWDSYCPCDSLRTCFIEPAI